MAAQSTVTLRKEIQRCLRFAMREFDPAKDYVISDGSRPSAKRRDEKIFFARWCHREGFKPEDVAELIELAERAAEAGVNYHNVNDPKMRPLYDAAMEACEVKCKEMGLVADWPGLYLTVIKGTQHLHLPYPSRDDEE